MRRRLLGYLVTWLLGAFLIHNSSFIIPVEAADEFFIDSTVEYKVESSGKTHVRHIISLENVFSALYAKEYSLKLEGIEVANPQVFQDGKPLRFDLQREGDKTSFEIVLETPVVGKGKSQTFEIIYDNFSFAQKTGDVWEISIPKIGDEKAFRNYMVRLIVPNSIGKEAYISPKPFQKLAENDNHIYVFDKEKILKTGVAAGFGEFQVFTFTLNYHLENPLPKTALSEIALPPDTAFQKIYYQSLNPEPKEVYLDQDANWLAVYELSPREKVSVTAVGAVQIFSDPLTFPKATGNYLSENLKETEYWQTSDPQIKSLATRLGTAKAIYDYVYQNLTYDYARVKPNVTRLGAKAILQNPSNAICMEFTDLFVALARSAGIPAREVNGYAYTENPKIQPLSLVSDVLHSWPEYWDEIRGAWIPVDPTWASTTQGIDYFNKLDLRHFTFVVHGTDPEKPYPAGSYKLGPNPQKDVYVAFGDLPEGSPESLEIKVLNKKPIPFLKTRLKITVKNSGMNAFYNLTPFVSFDNELVKTESIEVLPPYGSAEFNVDVPFSFLGRKTPETITVVAGNQEVSVPYFKRWVIIYNLVSIFFAVAVIVVSVLIKLKKINLGKFRFKNAKQNSETNPPQDI